MHVPDFSAAPGSSDSPGSAAGPGSAASRGPAAGPGSAAGRGPRGVSGGSPRGVGGFDSFLWDEHPFEADNEALKVNQIHNISFDNMLMLALIAC